MFIPKTYSYLSITGRTVIEIRRRYYNTSIIFEWVRSNLPRPYSRLHDRTLVAIRHLEDVLTRILDVYIVLRLAQTVRVAVRVRECCRSSVLFEKFPFTNNSLVTSMVFRHVKSILRITRRIRYRVCTYFSESGCYLRLICTCIENRPCRTIVRSFDCPVFRTTRIIRIISVV